MRYARALALNLSTAQIENVVSATLKPHTNASSLSAAMQGRSTGGVAARSRYRGTYISPADRSFEWSSTCTYTGELKSRTSQRVEAERLCRVWTSDSGDNANARNRTGTPVSGVCPRARVPATAGAPSSPPPPLTASPVAVQLDLARQTDAMICEYAGVHAVLIGKRLARQGRGCVRRLRLVPRRLLRVHVVVVWPARRIVDVLNPAMRQDPLLQVDGTEAGLLQELAQCSSSRCLARRTRGWWK